MKNRCLSAVLFSLLLFAAGCGESGPRTYPVSGKVTFDGKPVEQGEIIFRAADGAPGSWAAKITGGSYNLKSTVGAKRVEITATRKVEAKAAASGEGGFNFEMYLPAKYNEKSELTATVNAGSNSDINFDLKP